MKFWPTSSTLGWVKSWNKVPRERRFLVFGPVAFLPLRAHEEQADRLTAGPNKPMQAMCPLRVSMSGEFELHTLGDREEVQ